MHARIVLRLVFLPALLLASPPPAGALEKCVSSTGKTSYVEGACPAGTKSSTVRGTETPVPASPAAQGKPAGGAVQGKASASAARSKAAPPPEPKVLATAARGSAAVPVQPVMGMSGRREGTTQIDVKYLDVSGRDFDSLLAALKAAPGGLHGQAEWALSYQYKPRRAGKSCNVAELDTTLKQGMTLPRWTPPPGTSSSLTAAWFRYVNGLKKHSEGHLALGRDMLEAFRNSLAVTTARCEKLDEKIKAQYKTLLEEHRRQEKVYDFETASGRTEGVEFAQR